MIELLVVFAVIAIIASLLIPSLIRAKSSARPAVCKRNLRQIGIQIRLYWDGNGFYPRLNFQDDGGEEVVPGWSKHGYGRAEHPDEPNPELPGRKLAVASLNSCELDESGDSTNSQRQFSSRRISGLQPASAR
ncbi:MAG: type II secretion system protein [Verrucomicrobia bacterium]|nr:type II secretion system protein [Verrucomicrobiota bacterium]